MTKNNGVKATNLAVLESPVLEQPSVGVVVADPPVFPPPPEQAGARQSDVKMTGGANMAEAGRSILHHQLLKLRKAEPVAREGDDPEGVHDMRVATRRLRAALKVLEETVYDPGQSARYRKQLRSLAQALGETRDSDVFLEHLSQYTDQLGESEQIALEPLRRELLHRRIRSRKAMLKVLDKPKTRKLFDKLEQFATTTGSGVSQATSQEEIKPSLVRHFAGSAVWKRYEAVLAYETVINSQTPIEVLHRLRVACKQLRYTLEFFQEALPATAKSLQKQLVEVQDDLGSLHDHQVAADLSNSLLSDYPHDQALEDYRNSRAAEMEKTRLAFQVKWRTLVGSTYKRQLATSLANVTV